jgi:hypothetical protein
MWDETLFPQARSSRRVRQMRRRRRIRRRHHGRLASPS